MLLLHFFSLDSKSVEISHQNIQNGGLREFFRPSVRMRTSAKNFKDCIHPQTYSVPDLICWDVHYGPVVVLQLFDFSLLWIFKWAFLRKCIVTLVAFFFLFSNERFQTSPQMACLRGCIWLHLLCLFPLWIFKRVLKWLVGDDAQSQWLHLFYFSTLWAFICFLKLHVSWNA